MFIANITVKIMELQKPRQTLRLQQLILDQIQTDHQTHTGLRLENRQWGKTTNNNGSWALNFNTVLTAVIAGSPGYPSREFCGFSFSYTNGGWSFAAGYGGPGVTHINGITATAIALGF